MSLFFCEIVLDEIFKNRFRLKRDDVALIDRVEVNSIVVHDIIDMKRLVEKRIVTIEEGQKNYMNNISRVVNNMSFRERNSGLLEGRVSYKGE